MTGPATEHDYYDPIPIISRPRLQWPNGARLAMAFVISIEFYELRPAPGAFLPPNLPGGFGRGPYPDFRNYTHREYGPRVGLFRLTDIFARRGVAATAAIDTRTALERPAIVRHCAGLGFEIAAHGRAVTDVVSSAMSEERERACIADCAAALSTVTGKAPRGWHGAEYGESRATPRLLAEAGFDYLLDWPNDEQPYDMRCGSGGLTALPMLIDLDDVIAHWQHKITMARWRDCVLDAVDCLSRDGAESARMMILNLHPWLMGQAFRSTYLEEVLDAIAAREGVWLTTAGEIADAWTLARPTA